MKVLLHCGTPFFLAHGGAQIQIEQTKAALESVGVDVEYLRWWDGNQKADIIQFFGRPSIELVRMAHAHQIRAVISDLLTEQGSRSRFSHFAHRVAFNMARKCAPMTLGKKLASELYAEADACLALTPFESELMTRIYGATPAKVHVIPNGVEAEFLNEPTHLRGKWLVCTATITERKRVLELANAAIAARSPIWIIGKPYSEDDPYYQAFQKIAALNGEWIRYEGPISDRRTLAGIYREARGFVLLSKMESLSLSALEAAACECPLLLSDLPWARVSFSETASYCPISSKSTTARYLRHFYENAPSLASPPKPLTWKQVAEQLRSIYEELLRTPR